MKRQVGGRVKARKDRHSLSSIMTNKLRSILAWPSRPE